MWRHEHKPVYRLPVSWQFIVAVLFGIAVWAGIIWGILVLLGAA